MASDDPIVSSVAGRYASALFDLAVEQNQLQLVEHDVVAVQGMLEANPDLQRMVKSPVFSAEEQSRAIEAILTKVGVQKLTLNFFKLIARNRRLFAAPDMLQAFRTLAAKSRGEVRAEVTSAHPLNDAQLQALKETLRGTSGSKNVQITAKVDPALLGGLVVKIGSRMIDSSLRTKLNSLKTAMKGTG